MLYSAVQPFFRLQFLLSLLALICSQHVKAGENGNPEPAVCWSVSTGGPIYSSPVIDQQFLVFGSTDSSLYVVDHRSGKVAWTYKTGGASRCTPYVRN
ncbi:MAG TPA: PQQ-binding-like beta-propeller repeat protein, partial [Bacteroidia bacterium]|nr:PQQ-binding-like beta-propeller repeat protein [Bacteroidia bacterium]